MVAVVEQWNRMKAKEIDICTAGCRVNALTGEKMLSIWELLLLHQYTWHWHTVPGLENSFCIHYGTLGLNLGTREFTIDMRTEECVSFQLLFAGWSFLYDRITLHLAGNQVHFSPALLHLTWRVQEKVWAQEQIWAGGDWWQVAHAMYALFHPDWRNTFFSVDSSGKSRRLKLKAWRNILFQKILLFDPVEEWRQLPLLAPESLNHRVLAPDPLLLRNPICPPDKGCDSYIKGANGWFKEGEGWLDS